MDRQRFTSPLPLRSVRITDAFWGGCRETVLDKVIPYQWEALNDRVPGADKSGCIANFEIAAGRREGEHYGWVFQDSDLAKWLEAVAYALAVRPDPELERTADGAIELVCAAQQPDGYLNTYYTIKGLDKRFTNLRDNHELYCFGHMTEAAVAYYQAESDDPLRGLHRPADRAGGGQAARLPGARGGRDGAHPPLRHHA